MGKTIIQILIGLALLAMAGLISALFHTVTAGMVFLALAAVVLAVLKLGGGTRTAAL